MPHSLPERLRALIQCSPHEIVGPLLMLLLSGALGIALWPPPGMEVYSTLIAWTGISSPLGGTIRIVIALAGLVGWVQPVALVRKVAYVLVAACCLLLAMALYDSGQGFAAGAWSAAFIRATRALYAEESYGRSIDPATRRAIDRAISALGGH